MAQDTIIILCKNLNDAIMASTQIERRHDLNRLFVFLGKKPIEKDLKWLGSTDSSFCLERALDWGDKPELIGVRAGLMFANGWDLIFCWAENCPTSKDIDWVRGHLKSDGSASLPNVWGITRDYYILHGLGETTSQFSNVKVEQSNSIITGLQLADALSGLPVEEDVAVKALLEVVAISPLAVHESALRSNSLIEKIINAADYLDDFSPISILAGTDCDISAMREKLAANGALILVTQTLPKSDKKPYRTINLKDGSKIALYGK